MESQQGTSFLEALIALSVLSVSAFVALYQQWQGIINFNRLQQRQAALLLLNNASEDSQSQYDRNYHSHQQDLILTRHCAANGSCRLLVVWGKAHLLEHQQYRLQRQLYYAD